VLVRAARPAPQPAPAGEERAESLTGSFDDDGRYYLRGELDADHGRIVDAALSEARDALFQAGEVNVSWADALVEIAERSIDAASPPRRERFRAYWFVDPTDPIPARWIDGLPVPAWLRELLTCDGAVAPVYTNGALPVSVGRSVQDVPDRTRRLVLYRDRKCRVPWCGQRRWLQVHHVHHRAAGGGHDTATLIALCPPCHRAHHKGEFEITGNADEPDGLTFTDGLGNVIDPAARPIKPTGPPPAPAKPYEHPIGGRLYKRELIFRDPPVP
jgi:HNH endonuclease